MMRAYLLLVLILSVAACKKTDEGTSSLQVFIPNSFYPGSAVPCPSGDPSCNTVFKVIVSNASLPLLKSFELRVYTTSGTELFHTTDHNEGWNGRNKNEQPMQTGLYTYLLKCIDTDDHTMYKQNSVMLVR